MDLPVREADTGVWDPPTPPGTPSHVSRHALWAWMLPSLKYLLQAPSVGVFCLFSCALPVQTCSVLILSGGLIWFCVVTVFSRRCELLRAGLSVWLSVESSPGTVLGVSGCRDDTVSVEGQGEQGAGF